MLPKSRRNTVLVQEVGEELVVYDLERHHAHRLNRTTALVWRHADGRTSIAEMVTLVERELGVPASEQVVWLALDQLNEAHLLRDQPPRSAEEQQLSRRQAIALGLAGAAALLLPGCESVTSPTPQDVLEGRADIAHPQWTDPRCRLFVFDGERCECVTNYPHNPCPGPCKVKGAYPDCECVCQDPRGGQPKCGPDISGALLTLVNEVTLAYNTASAASRVLACSYFVQLQSWDTELLNCAGLLVGCPSGQPCTCTYELFGSCIKGPEANYFLYGVINRLCGSTKDQMNNKISFWKDFRYKEKPTLATFWAADAGWSSGHTGTLPPPADACPTKCGTYKGKLKWKWGPFSSVP